MGSQKWFLDYMKAIIERDVCQIAKVDHLRQMPRLIRILTQHSAQLVNFGMNHVTTQRYTEIFDLAPTGQRPRESLTARNAIPSL